KLDFDNASGKRAFYAPTEHVKQLQLNLTIANNNSQYALKPSRFVAYFLSNEMPGSQAQLLRDNGGESQLSASAAPNEYGNYG
ncbi:hypothetical protein R0J93_26675, partial [Pseudoalteromonas sp. SIMBA_148]